MKNYLPISKLSYISCTALLIGAVFVASSAQAGPADSLPGTAPTPLATSNINIPSVPAIPSAVDGSAPSVIPAADTPPEFPSTPKSLPAPAPGISIPAPPPANALVPPPPSTAFSNDAVKLATQAEQAAMQAQGGQNSNDQAKRERDHIEKSYDRASSGLLPLSPDQIRDFMHRLEKTQEAAEPPSGGPPKGDIRVATLTLDPGVEPPQINLAAGYVSTITIVDASGQPWPILDVGVGGNFEVSSTQNGTHVVRITPLTRFGAGDLSVLLKDLPTPIIFRLTAGGPSVDLRYDARVPKYGPNGKVPLIDHPMLEAGDGDIMMVLENSPPKTAKRIKISGLDARTMAWSMNGKVFVRTPLTLLSPAWNSSVSSADGMRVYEIGDAPVLLMSDNGAMLRGRLVQEDDHD